MLLHDYGSGQRSRDRPKKKRVDNINENCSDLRLTISVASWAVFPPNWAPFDIALAGNFMCWQVASFGATFDWRVRVFWRVVIHQLSLIHI